MTLAKGTFSVSLNPVTTDKMMTAPAQFARMTIDKEFSGDLTGTSIGEMLSTRLADCPSAGYVALEQVTAELMGKSGSFVLQHYGVMTANDSTLILKVLPDSATDELAGLRGEMSIDIVDGEHHYELSFQL